MKDYPDLSEETLVRMEDMSWFTSAQIFDDLLIVSQQETACFVWKTSEGLVVFDGIWPDAAVYDAIIQAIEAAGWDPDTLCKFVITHGHTDHTGCGKWLVDGHKVTTYLSRVDDAFWRDNPIKPDRPDTWKDFDIDCYVGEGDTIYCGDKAIQVISTPGHTPGCLSFFFPVHDRGKAHMAAILGGSTPPWTDPAGKEVQRQSIDHFVAAAREWGADVLLSTHTAFDKGLERIAYSQARLSYMPNIYVLNREDFENFCDVYKRIIL